MAHALFDEGPEPCVGAVPQIVAQEAPREYVHHRGGPDAGAGLVRAAGQLRDVVVDDTEEAAVGALLAAAALDSGTEAVL